MYIIPLFLDFYLKVFLNFKDTQKNFKDTQKNFKDTQKNFKDVESFSLLVLYHVF